MSSVYLWLEIFLKYSYNPHFLARTLKIIIKTFSTHTSLTHTRLSDHKNISTEQCTTILNHSQKKKSHNNVYLTTGH